MTTSREVIAEQCAASRALVAAFDASVRSMVGPLRRQPFNWEREPEIATDTDPTPVGIVRPCPASRGGSL